MRHFSIISLLAVSLAGLTPAAAQETATPEAPAAEAPAAQAPAADAAVPDATPVEDLSLGQPAEGGIGSTYTEATHGDWEQRCVRTEDGADPCQLYQLLKDSTGGSVAEISIVGLAPGGQIAAGATAIVPLETLLTQELQLQIDGGDTKRYPFSWCSPIGCISRIGFTAEEVAALKNGAAAKMTIVPVVSPNERVIVNISLKGFTAGYDAVNAANQAAAPAEPPKE